MDVKRYKTALAVVLVFLVGLTSVSYAETRGGGAGRGGFRVSDGVHGGAGQGGGHGAFHGGGFHGHPAFHGRPGFHPGFHGRAVIGLAPFWWGPSYVYAPPAYAYPAPSGYWYYCPSAQTYYPYVQTCPGAWVPVPAS